jgi:isochorismate synthase
MTSICTTFSDRAVLETIVSAGVTSARQADHPILVSYTIRTSFADALALFEAGRALEEQAFLWIDAARDHTIAAVGVAHQIAHTGADRFNRVRQSWSSLFNQALIEGHNQLPAAGPTLLGGFAFDADSPRTALWSDFADASLVLPQLQLTTYGGDAALTYNLVVTPTTDPETTVDELFRLYDDVTFFASNRSPACPHPIVDTCDVLPADAWQAIVGNTVAAIKRGAFDKAAIARSIRLTSDRVFDVGQALRYLRDTYPSAYIFAVTRGESCFLGATPERLVGVQAGAVRATGLAGTARRGTTAAEDAQIGAALLQSGKERHEHDVVVRMLRDVLATACDNVTAADVPELLKLNNVQHLYTPVTGRLRNGRTLLDLVARLHPTPAVGGLPRAAARAFIRENERLDRGWYSGPIGWLDARGEGEFVVALRCGLVQGDTATLFAGNGIVDRSEPEREYAETCLKFQPMLKALGAAQNS